MINGVTMKINVDDYILNALKEDITSEDVTTNAVMREAKKGKADLICKQDGIICGLDVFKRVFELLSDDSTFETSFKDGDKVKKGDVLCIIEAMKLMNEITAEEDGVITEVCVSNGQVVDFGHILFKMSR